MAERRVVRKVFLRAGLGTRQGVTEVGRGLRRGGLEEAGGDTRHRILHELRNLRRILA